MPANATRTQIETEAGLVGGLGDIQAKTSQVTDDGPSGKTLTATGTVPSIAGTQNVGIVVKFRPHCIFYVAGAWADDAKGDRAKAFVDSLKRLASAVAPQAAADEPQADSSSAPVVNESTTINGRQATLEKCGVTAAFTEEPERSDDQGLSNEPSYSDMATYDKVQYRQGDYYAELADCTCFIKMAPSMVTEDTAVQQFERENKGQVEVETKRFVAEFADRKIFDLTGKTPSPSGPVSVIAKEIYQRHCVLRAVAIAHDVQSLESAKRFVAGLGANPSASTPAAPSGDIERRLQQLKDLFDRSLITKDEYDAKRKEILEGL